MDTYEIVVFEQNSKRTSQLVDRYDAAESFGDYVYRHMGHDGSCYDAMFDASRHFISFSTPVISVMMLGFISEELFEKTKREVWKLIHEQLPPRRPRE